MNNQILVTRIGYSYLPTTKIDESINWYVNNLGLKLMNKFEDRGSLIAVLHYPHKNSIALVLVDTKDYKPLEIMRNGSPFPLLAMNCPDIENIHKRLKENDIQIEDISILGNGEAKYFYFRDNEGNLLEAAWSKWDAEDDIKAGF